MGQHNLMIVLPKRYRLQRDRLHSNIAWKMSHIIKLWLFHKICLISTKYIWIKYFICRIKLILDNLKQRMKIELSHTLSIKVVKCYI
jgi:hypothetical protein